MSGNDRKIAILSVFNKSGLVDLAKGLAKANVRLLASGGTARMIRDANIAVEDVSAVTKAPEMLGGRVKTLHPVVHGGILARNLESDEKDLAAQGISKVDFVVCNLYPFQETVAKTGVTVPQAVEEIDIGGVTLLRAAAKNFSRVTVLSDPADYHGFLDALEGGKLSEELRQQYALKAFTHTAQYDEAISDYFRSQFAGNGLQHAILRYGTNPHQKPAVAFVENGNLPFKALSGSPGYINLLDVLNSWGLVNELDEALGMAAAASFKHVSPAGAAVGVPLSDDEKKVYMVHDIDGIDQSPLAQAYARARGADRMSSFGDIIALSREVDLPTAKIISREVSDGVVAPSYSPEALEVLKKKKAGKYLVLAFDKTFRPGPVEERTVYGVHLRQRRNDAKITPQTTFSKIAIPKSGATLPESARRDLTVATLALKYTQSNSVCYARNGQTVGLGAGQQSRIHCTRLAGDKADGWWMRFHPRALGLRFRPGVRRPDKSNAVDLLANGFLPEAGPERDEFDALFAERPAPFSAGERAEWLRKLDGVAASSDAFFPFSDNVFRLARSGVKYVAAPTGSVNDSAVFDAAEKSGMVFVEQPTRLFHH